MGYIVYFRLRYHMESTRASLVAGRSNFLEGKESSRQLFHRLTENAADVTMLRTACQEVLIPAGSDTRNGDTKSLGVQILILDESQF